MLIRIGGDNNIAWDANSVIYYPLNPSLLFRLGEKVLTCVLIDSHLLINSWRILLLT